MGVPLYVICHFSLAAFTNFSLCLIFANLITMLPEATQLCSLPGLFSGANDRLWEGSRQGVLPRTSVASVLVPRVSRSQPPPLQETLQH